MSKVIRSFAIILLSITSYPTHHANAFTPPSSSGQRQQYIISTSHRYKSKKIIDAEFTHSDEAKNKIKDMTLIEYSQNQDPDWKNMPVAFCDLQTNTYIDCTLAFYVKSEDGEEYCLGVPCEVPVVVAVEVEGAGDDATLTNLARVLPINPDDTDVEGCFKINEEEKKEIFEIAARALSDEFGKQIRLKKTPRVLTVQGDLDAIVGDWKEVLIGSSDKKESKMKRPDIEEALKILDEDEEEGERYFDMIMRRDLGDDYMKLIEDDDNDVIDEDILKLFDVNAEDLEDGDMEEFLKFMNDSIGGDEELNASKTAEEILQDLKPSAALKLLSFIGPDEKEFTVLRPLRPLLLVGREDPDDYTRRILLSEDEKRLILPDLERVCKDKLEQAGFFLSGSDK